MSSRQFAGAHGLDYSGSAGYRIAAGEHAFSGASTGFFINLNAAACVFVQSFGGIHDELVQAGTQSHDDTVYVQSKLGTLNGNRSATSGSIRLAQFHFDALDLVYVVVLVAQNANRVVQQVELNALFLCVLDFLGTSRHLISASPVNYMDLSAHSFSASCCVHGNVSAAYNRNLLVLFDWSVVLVQVALHQVDSGQILVGGVYAYQVLAFDVHELRKAGTGTDEYSIVSLIEQVLDIQGSAHYHVVVESDALLPQGVDFVCHDILWQTEFRNSVYQHAALFVETLENGYFVSLVHQITGSGQSGRAGTDNGNLLAVGWDFFYFIIADVLSVPIRYETLQSAYSNRLALDSANALSFALGFLRAYTAAHCRQGVGGSNHFIGTGKIPLGYLCDEFRNPYVYRTSCHARLVFTIEATLRFVYRHLLGISQSNFLKILISDIRFLRRHRCLCHLIIHSVLHLLSVGRYDPVLPSLLRGNMHCGQ